MNCLDHEMQENSEKCPAQVPSAEINILKLFVLSNSQQKPKDIQFTKDRKREKSWAVPLVKWLIVRISLNSCTIHVLGQFNIVFFSSVHSANICIWTDQCSKGIRIIEPY